jgi:membrane protein implicated in regulation of membrane protease activity
MKRSLERYLRQAVVMALAGGLFIVAAVFGLLAAYHALVSIYQFSALEAAAIMATCLLLVGLMVHRRARSRPREEGKGACSTGEVWGVITPLLTRH